MYYLLSKWKDTYRKNSHNHHMWKYVEMCDNLHNSFLNWTRYFLSIPQNASESSKSMLDVQRWATGCCTLLSITHNTDKPWHTAGRYTHEKSYNYRSFLYYLKYYQFSSIMIYWNLKKKQKTQTNKNKKSKLRPVICQCKCINGNQNTKYIFSA